METANMIIDEIYTHSHDMDDFPGKILINQAYCSTEPAAPSDHSCVT